MMTSIVRSNGKVFSIKDNVNRFFFPKEYLQFEEKLSKKAKFSVRFLLNTGARINEARNVKVEDVDLVNKRMTLRVTKTKAKKGEKHGRIRIIPLSSQFVKILKEKIKEDNLTFDSYFGIMENSNLNVAYKVAGVRAGIKDYYNISSHTFRKTLEVWLMALGVDALPLTAHLGHSIGTAAQYYVSPDIFSSDDKFAIKRIIGDLYADRLR